MSLLVATFVIKAGVDRWRPYTGTDALPLTLVEFTGGWIISEEHMVAPDDLIEEVLSGEIVWSSITRMKAIYDPRKLGNHEKTISTHTSGGQVEY